MTPPKKNSRSAPVTFVKKKIVAEMKDIVKNNEMLFHPFQPSFCVAFVEYCLYEQNIFFSAGNIFHETIKITQHDKLTN